MREHFFMTDDDWYEVAKIIDNEFNGSRDTFRVKKRACVILDSGKCDECSIVNVYSDKGVINKIERIGPDTDGWQEVHEKTYFKINNWLTDN